MPQQPGTTHETSRSGQQQCRPTKRGAPQDRAPTRRVGLPPPLRSLLLLPNTTLALALPNQLSTKPWRSHRGGGGRLHPNTPIFIQLPLGWRTGGCLAKIAVMTRWLATLLPCRPRADVSPNIFGLTCLLVLIMVWSIPVVAEYGREPLLAGL